MDPEQRLLIIHKYFPVECFVIFIAALIRMFHPQRMNITDGYRTFVDFYFFFCRRNFYNFFFSVFIFFFLGFRILMNMFYDNIIVTQIGFIDRLIFLFSVLIREENLGRHEGTVFFQNFTDSVLVGKFQAVFV